ncbi:MAG: bifunctional methylenetetrahydrofolate dehydrogenase/methenyltetrahydrofolate cyclohydrolase FolD [Zetaproteobacteria bacterium CG12_big_fil_rev_8_21_14_0_65_54_13]|nr:MAG: bifunctional methylenetetrahydrofolate dehydrogenase/methenyltetrahydrofolate cyclohydrolase FolD [Zetaproteobacteria bacterium CG12_big_fil_rev_8_21_14_0_65_54_13]PIX54537.1 MAG: bifunctional methylenetetrahydrofolate dehydrogenase/methenyltetrahydrofolate cyclohydrolase FolD [Zetaproteobacteria bacterium CG_4_10_14_3_um_filter_54_28]PJA29746.1 MAG: bifunctional methylenetetrahydrofolate dehydrogenase/methenyltetrahydrofolate cyclohydrolase FolD [Zetaproteobacteria bacterium CG_4_9_14_3_
MTITTAQILDGKALAHRLRKEIGTEVAELTQKHGRAPGLAVILVGDDPASHVYVRNKKIGCENVGFASFSYELPADTSQQHLLGLISELNRDPKVDGILVQLPVPAHINSETILEAIDPGKDVDGFHPYNIGRLTARKPALRSCTPYGCMKLLEETGLDLHGMESVIVGASNIVGRPMALELLLAGATVTVCHRFTKNLQAHIERADIVIAAAGKQGLIQGEWIKPGAVVIDVGIHRRADGTLTGDVAFESASKRAGWITPVPGGVGPMTITMLLANTVQAFKNHIGESDD